MITTWEEYKNNYLDLLVNNELPVSAEKMVNPETEPKFKINANTRTITIPQAFQNGVAVYKDYQSETLFFEIDRYFDIVDFYYKNCCVQFINAEGNHYFLPITYKYISKEDNTKLILGWTLPQEVAAKEGEVTFSIRFFSVSEETLDYNWSTRPATIKVYKGLYVTTGGVTIPPKSTIEQLLDKIESVWNNNDAGRDYNDLNNKPNIDGVTIVGDIASTLKDFINGNIGNGAFLTIDDVLTELIIPNNDKGRYPVSNNGLFTKFEGIDVSIQELQQDLESIKNEIGDMTFIPISINSFTIEFPNLVSNVISGNPALVENGTIVNQLKFIWNLSKAPNSIIITNKRNSTEVYSKSSLINSTGYCVTNFPENITSTTMFELKVQDRGEPVITTAELIFCDKTYWTVRGLVDADSIDQAFILDYLTGQKLTPTSNFEINVNIRDKDYLYIALPKSILIKDNFNFYFDGSALSGGMNFIKDMSITRNNYTAEYKIYRSTNAGLGQRTIKIE